MNTYDDYDQRPAQGGAEMVLPYFSDAVKPLAEPTELAEKPPTTLFTQVGELITDLQPPRWLIKSLIEKDSLAVLYGKPGDGKSFLAIDMAASVATGTNWHSKKTAPGAVFYIAGEGQNGLARRFKGWEIARDVSLKDAPLLISCTPIGLDIEENAINVKEVVTALASQLKQKPVLIVVDTLARNFAGDENSTKDMNSFVRGMDSLRIAWGTSILIVHHTGKDISKGARGSSVLNAAIDAEYSVKMDENNVITMASHKMKEAELPPPLAFKLQRVKLPIDDEDGDDLWSCTPVAMTDDYIPPKRGSKGAGKNQILALECLAKLYHEHEERLKDSGKDPHTALVTIEEWREKCKQIGIIRPRFNEVKNSLDEQDRVELDSTYIKLKE